MVTMNARCSVAHPLLAGPVGERTSSVPVAEVGEPPDVTQAHGVAHAGENKLDLVPPVAPSRDLRLLRWLARNGSILREER